MEGKIVSPLHNETDRVAGVASGSNQLEFSQTLRNTGMSILPAMV